MLSSQTFQYFHARGVVAKQKLPTADRRHLTPPALATASHARHPQQRLQHSHHPPFPPSYSPVPSARSSYPSHPASTPASTADMPSATGSSWEKYQKNFADDEVEEKKITPLTDE